jgi:single-stranded DNA-binding protein
LVTVRTESPTRRVDVIPVTLWDPPEELLNGNLKPGRRVWVAGSVQRRFWSGDQDEGRRSRLEVVAEQICPRTEEDT